MIRRISARNKLKVLLLALCCLAMSVWAYSGEGKKKHRKNRQDPVVSQPQNPVTPQPGPDASPSSQYDKHSLAFYVEPQIVSFVRPGLKFTIQNVTIGDDRRIVVTFLVTDDRGLPLDRLGVTTPGPVSTSFVASYLPQGQEQYVAYTTRIQTSPITKASAIQGTADSGGTYKQIGDGIYTYTFKTVLPQNYDRTATTTVSMWGTRNLAEFDLGTQTANTVYSFVPDGSPVTHIRDVVSTASCNKCHDPLKAHEGARQLVGNCILCHNPQSSDPDTGNTVDFKVMVHKIHQGPNLPSVKAGHPYVIIGFNQGVNDFSDTTFPRDPRDCSACHDGTASQALAYLTRPSAAACGSCHDDVNFKTGKNHPGGPQADDSQCATCHIPQGDVEFDASVKGAHTIPQFSQDLPGVNFDILSVTNTGPGQKPTVRLKITDKNGFPVETSQMSFLNLVISGPNTDYATYWSESLLKTKSSNGEVTYTFNKAIPADATGSYTVGVEGYRLVTLQPGTTKEVKGVRDVGFNKTVPFAVTDPQPVPRRQVIAQQNCDSCHGHVSAHGGIRQNVQYCELCHNANADDSARRPASQMPPQSIHFKLLIHKIHTGEDLHTDYTVYGFGNVPNNFNDVTFPGDRRDCEKCHIPGSEELPLPDGLLPTITPRDYINPEQPATAACLSCHDTKAAASHASLNTSSTLGEACSVCHGQTSQWSVDRVHAR